MSKKLVAYFTGSGQTQTAATKISQLLKCDIYEIKSKIIYTTKDLDWDDTNSRSTVECKDRNCRPELADKNLLVTILFLLVFLYGGILLQI